MSKKTDLIARDGAHTMQTYGRFDIALERGAGATLYGFDGESYIDFASGIGTCSVGYAHPKWTAAVSAQAGKLAHVSNLFYSEPYIALAERLAALSGLERTFFCNSGAEANEGLIKLARKRSRDKYGDGRSDIVTLDRSFHGRTVTTLAATGQTKFHDHFFPFTEGFRHVPPGDIAALKAQPDGVCAVLLELVQGEGGIHPLEKAYVAEVAALCRERDWLLLVDEVQTGVGRTGSFFAYEDYGILPDAVSFAKGIAGGLPLGGFIAGKRTADVLTPGLHATTFGGNPIACAAALSVIDILVDGGEMTKVAEKGDYIRSRIEGMGLAAVTGTRGKGLMIGAAVAGVAPIDAAKALHAGGLIVITAGSDALRLLPPLTISRDEIDRGLEIFETVMRRF